MTIAFFCFLAGCGKEYQTSVNSMPSFQEEPSAKPEVIVSSSNSINDSEPELPIVDQDYESPKYERIPVPDEVFGVWISYHEWEDMPSEQDEFEKYVDAMMENIVNWGMNTIYVHVHADADAMYPSKIFPWSKYVTGTQGSDPGYDPFLYFVEAAHKNNLRIHAWINPYRVTHKDCTIEEMCTDNPANIWINGDESDKRCVLLHDGNLYFNPAKEEVQKLILSGINEILENYDIDGIHMDDYFYPTINDSDSQTWFDKPEYDQYEGNLSITQWRRNNVSTLVKDIYELVKSYDSEIEFGISPAGNIDNLLSSRQYFTDIELWMSQPGYVDYLMPQLYWGFEARKKDGTLAPYAFENNMNRWISLKKSENVKLYLGLAMYQAGTDVYDNNPTSEWLSNDNIISRQVQAGQATNEIAGYVFYAYSSFLKPEAQNEVNNLIQDRGQSLCPE